MSLVPSKALPPMEETFSGISILVRAEFLNNPDDISLILAERRTSVKELHPAKADAPIEDTELGIISEDSPVQFSKADQWIVVTELGIDK